MDEILNRLLPEGMDKLDFYIYLGYFCAGAFVNFFLDVRSSVKHNPNTPRKFSLRYLVVDNILRGLAVAILIVVTLLNFEELTGTALTGLLAFAFGMDIDVIIGKFLSEGKNVGAYKRQREKLLTKLNGGKP
jgi:hypothetical protein